MYYLRFVIKLPLRQSMKHKIRFMCVSSFSRSSLTILVSTGYHLTPVCKDEDALQQHDVYIVVYMTMVFLFTFTLTHSIMKKLNYKNIDLLGLIMCSFHFLPSRFKCLFCLILLTVTLIFQSLQKMLLIIEHVFDTKDHLTSSTI